MTSVAPSRRKAQQTGVVPDDAAIMLRLYKARTSLILEHPFIGTIALNMPMELDDNIPTAATNGKRVKYNREFVMELSDEEVKFLVAHECMHPMLEHNYRRGSRDPRKWNKAGDYVINKLLTEDRIGKMPANGLLNDAIWQAGGGSTDGIYHIRPDEPGGGGGGGYGGEGDPMDDCEDAEGSPAEQAQAQAEWKVKVAQAAQAAKMMGKMSAGLQRLVDEVLSPKVDWRDVLYRFLTKCKTDDRSFARPNRRFISQGLYLPTVSGEVLGELLFAVDCSGSIGQDELNQFAAEVRCVKDDMFPTKIHVVYFDSEVSHYECYEQQDDLNIQPHGGGGTAFSPVFEYMREHNIEPVAVVFLTDLYCDDYGNPPDCPVLWVSTHDHADGHYGKPPFGEVVVM